MVKLKGIDVSGIRGFPKSWGNIEIGDRGLVVYGDNGTGKSSIVDAIECILSRDVTLFPESRQGVSWDNAAQHVRCDAYNVSLMLHSNGTEVSIGKTTKSQRIPDEIRKYIDTAKSNKFVFRRHQLISFILNQPKDRYAALEGFLELEKFTEIENKIKQIVEQIKSKKVAAQAECAGHEAGMRRILFSDSQNTIDDTSIIKALNVFLTAAQIPECSAIANAKDALKTAEAKARAEISEKRLGAISALKSALQRMPTSEELAHYVESLLDAASGLIEARSVATEEGLIDWLIKGREVVSQDSTGYCPLCKQSVDQQDLLVQLDARISSNRRYIEARSHFASRSGEFCSAAKRSLDALPGIISDWGTTVGGEVPKELADYEKFLENALKQAKSIPPSLEAIRSIGDRLRKGLPIADFIRTVDGLFTAEGGARRQAVMSAVSAAAAVATDYPKVVTLRQRAMKIEQHHTELIRVQALASDARKAIVQSIFEKVSGYANVFYEQIHPKESIGNSCLAVKRTADKSVTLTAAFDGKQEHPMLHYSESHLDTLGLCYFLAVRRNGADKNPNFKVLILDDVLTSVDATHRQKIAFLLKDNFSDHQVIITTHDKIFYDRLKSTFASGQFRYVAISTWDIDRGPLLMPNHSDFEKIRAPHRDVLSQEDLSAASGRAAECLLRDIADGVRCAIPYRADGKYTMADLWSPIKSKLEKQNGFMALHGKLTATLDSCAWVRNQCGAHYGTPAAPVTMTEAREFAIALEELYDAMFCKKCSRIVTLIPGTKDWRCHCGNIQYLSK